MRRPGRRQTARWHWAIAVPLVVVGLIAVGPTTASIPVVYLAVVTPELVRVDLRERRLPNALTVPGIAIGALTWAVESLHDGRIDLPPLAAGVGYAGVLLALALLGGMGLGDVKLGAALGFASWLPLVGVLSPVIAFLAGAVASVFVLLARGRGQRMAFGPHMLGGFWAAVGVVALSRV